MALEGVIAGIATVLVILGYVPQIIKGYRTKSLKDLSWGLLLVAGVGISLWAFYGILNQDRIFFIANITIVASILVLMIMKLRYN